MGYAKNKIVLTVLALCSLQGEADSKEDPRFKEHHAQTGIVYKTVNGESLELAFLSPTVEKYEKAPVVVYIHGGGWAKGSNVAVFCPNTVDALTELRENGIACATIRYRFTRPEISTAYDCVVDCKDAVRFLIKHAEEYGIDPTRIATWGGSAGGHLCLMTALAPDDKFPGAPELQGIVPKFCGVVSCCPATTFLVPEIYNQSNFKNRGKWNTFFGGLPGEAGDLPALLSPVEHLTKDSPPVFLIHGNKDEVLSYDNSTYMLERAKQIGANVKLLTVINGPHAQRGEDCSPDVAELNRVKAEFLLNCLTVNR